jgi:hypothetical protein
MAGDEVSAQVILRDGARAAPVADFFDSAGFATGPLVGTSFAITAPRDGFESTFGTEAADLAGAEAAAELPLGALPEELADAIEAVATQGPPDFGPPP